MMTKYTKVATVGIVNKIITSAVSALIIILGYIRNNYIINLFIEDLPLFIPRRQFTEEISNSIMVTGNTDPRWISSIIYSGLFIISTCVTIYFLFFQKLYMKITLVIYSILIILIFLLVLFKQILGFDFTGHIASKMASILQDLMMPVFLIAVFFLHEKIKNKG